MQIRELTKHLKTLNTMGYQNCNPQFTSAIYWEDSENWGEDIKRFLETVLNLDFRGFLEEESVITEIMIVTNHGDIYYQPSMNSLYHPKLSYLREGDTGVTVEDDKLYIMPDHDDWLRDIDGKQAKKLFPISIIAIKEIRVRTLD